MVQFFHLLSMCPWQEANFIPPSTLSKHPVCDGTRPQSLPNPRHQVCSNKRMKEHDIANVFEFYNICTCICRVEQTPWRETKDTDSKPDPRWTLCNPAAPFMSSMATHIDVIAVTNSQKTCPAWMTNPVPRPRRGWKQPLQRKPQNLQNNLQEMKEHTSA